MLNFYNVTEISSWKKTEESLKDIDKISKQFTDNVLSNLISSKSSHVLYVFYYSRA